MNPPLHRRQLLQLAGAALALAHGHALAQSGQISRLYAGFPPGGTADALARSLAPLFSSSGPQTIVENKPGASGQLAAVAVKQAPPDGLSLLLTPTSILTLTPHLYRKPLFDPLTDFSPIGPVCEHPFALAVNGNSPIRTVAEFIAWGKAHPHDVSYATPGAGTSTHFLGMLFGKETGVAMTHVAYKGVAPGLLDLMSGQIASTFNPLPAMIEFHRAGKIRVLATTHARRLASLPDVPTFTELKLPGLEYVELYGLFAASRTPGPVMKRLEASLQQAIANPGFVESSTKLELEPRKDSTAAYQRFFEADYKRWAGIAKESGFQLDT